MLNWATQAPQFTNLDSNFAISDKLDKNMLLLSNFTYRYTSRKIIAQRYMHKNNYYNTIDNRKMSLKGMNLLY